MNRRFRQTFQEEKMNILRTINELNMSILHTFCLEGSKARSKRQAIISENHQTTGTVTAVKTCWWIKINTKPVRLHALDGVKFPHIIYFTYYAGGAAHEGSVCISYYSRCPSVGEAITVFFAKNDPAKYAVRL